MKIQKLQINKFRGIVDLILTPGEESLVLWGPNGSGKSAVVDAIDFLLTGKIARLLGEGTSGISLKEHGPHIDYGPEDAFVSATIVIPGYKNALNITRRISEPKKLEYPKEAEKAIMPVLEVASKGQNVLSRREILKFIASEANKRASEIQALLNLSEIESLRKSFNRASVLARVDVNNSKDNFNLSESTLALDLSLKSEDLNKDIVLGKINQFRKVLGGEPIKAIETIELKDGLSFTTISKSEGFDIEVVEKNILDLQLESDGEQNIGTLFDRLDSHLGHLTKNKESLDGLSKLKLLKLGVTLVADDGHCPLCGTKWVKEDLVAHINDHIDQADEAKKKSEEIDKIAECIREKIVRLQAPIGNLTNFAMRLGLEDISQGLSNWATKLKSLIEVLKNPIQEYKPLDYKKKARESNFAPSTLNDWLKLIKTRTKEKFPKLSDKERAWDALTKTEENIKRYESSKKLFAKKQKAQEQSEILSSLFEETVEEVLTELYREIESVFSDLYGYVNEDESSFATSFRQEGAGVKLEVDFYNRGKFPPLALHSEGHQDTMGICLYLALSERLASGVINMTVFDDVVMSVDSNHRRKICALLKAKFPARQFIITTHDRTWARQLVTTNVVPRKNSVNFMNWNIDTGPAVLMEQQIWGKIDSQVAQNEISDAAAALRRHCELFFEFVCDNLRAQIRYRSDGNWTLGDYASAAISAYKKLLADAKRAANSWGDKGSVQNLSERETVVNQIILRSQIDQWDINKLVHYTNWENFTKNDFLPIVEAWRDLFDIFTCSHCGGVVYITTGSTKSEKEALKCDCNRINLNLKEKTKSTKII